MTRANEASSTLDLWDCQDPADCDEEEEKVSRGVHPSLSSRLLRARTRTRDALDSLEGSSPGAGSPAVCQSPASQILGNAARRRNWEPRRLSMVRHLLGFEGGGGTDGSSGASSPATGLSRSASAARINATAAATPPAQLASGSYLYTADDLSLSDLQAHPAFTAKRQSRRYTSTSHGQQYDQGAFPGAYSCNATPAGPTHDLAGLLSLPTDDRLSTASLATTHGNRSSRSTIRSTTQGEQQAGSVAATISYVTGEPQDSLLSGIPFDGAMMMPAMPLPACPLPLSVQPPSCAAPLPPTTPRLGKRVGSLAGQALGTDALPITRRTSLDPALQPQQRHPLSRQSSRAGTQPLTASCTPSHRLPGASSATTGGDCPLYPLPAPTTSAASTDAGAGSVLLPGAPCISGLPPSAPETPAASSSGTAPASPFAPSTATDGGGSMFASGKLDIIASSASCSASGILSSSSSHSSQHPLMLVTGRVMAPDSPGGQQQQQGSLSIKTTGRPPLTPAPSLGTPPCIVPHPVPQSPSTGTKGRGRGTQVVMFMTASGPLATGGAEGMAVAHQGINISGRSTSAVHDAETVFRAEPTSTSPFGRTPSNASRASNSSQPQWPNFPRGLRGQLGTCGDHHLYVAAHQQRHSLDELSSASGAVPSVPSSRLSLQVDNCCGHATYVVGGSASGHDIPATARLLGVGLSSGSGSLMPATVFDGGSPTKVRILSTSRGDLLLGHRLTASSSCTAEQGHEGLMMLMTGGAQSADAANNPSDLVAIVQQHQPQQPGGSVSASEQLGDEQAAVESPFQAHKATDVSVTLSGKLPPQQHPRRLPHQQAQPQLYPTGGNSIVGAASSGTREQEDVAVARALLARLKSERLATGRDSGAGGAAGAWKNRSLATSRSSNSLSISNAGGSSEAAPPSGATAASSHQNSTSSFISRHGPLKTPSGRMANLRSHSRPLLPSSSTTPAAPCVLEEIKHTSSVGTSGCSLHTSLPTPKYASFLPHLSNPALSTDTTDDVSQHNNKALMLGGNSSFMAPVRGPAMYAGEFLSPPSGKTGDTSYCPAAADLASMPCTLEDHQLIHSAASNAQVLEYASCPTQPDASAYSRTYLDGPSAGGPRPHLLPSGGPSGPVALPWPISRQELLAAGRSEGRAGGKLGSWFTRLGQGSVGAESSREIRGEDVVPAQASRASSSRSHHVSTRASLLESEDALDTGRSTVSQENSSSGGRGISHGLRTLAQMFRG